MADVTLTPREAALVRAVRSLRRAETEMRRATDRGEQPRMQKAGNRYYFAKSRLYRIAWEVENGRL